MNTKTFVHDPVCGMEFSPEEAYTTRQVGEQTVYFCSEMCTHKFDANPPLAPLPEAAPMVGSATTGVSPELRRSVRLDLPVSGLSRSGGPRGRVRVPVPGGHAVQ